MFEYVKEKSNNILDECNRDFNLSQKRKEEVENTILNISDFECLKTKLRTNKIMFGLFISGLCLSLGLMIPLGVNIFLGICSLYSLVKSIEYKVHISRNSYILQSEYLDYLDLTQEELEKKKISLNHEKDTIESNIKQIKLSLNYYHSILDSIKSYESDGQFFAYKDILCLKDAKTLEDVADLRLKKEICDNMSFADYLNEKINYSNIHFDDGIDSCAHYNDNTKKLIKKM